MKKIVFVLLLILCGCQISSNNEGALSYKNEKCVVFYPDNNEEIAKYAKNLCSSGEELIYDYTVTDKGTYKIVSYIDNQLFYVNDDYSPLLLKVQDNIGMLRDILRYQMKKDGIDEAYTADFMIKTAEENFDVSDTVCKINEDSVSIYFPSFDYQLKLPFEYAQSIVKVNFGVEDKHFDKKIYVDPNRPLLALTFDDGPYWPVDSIIYETLSTYDCRATFFFVGDRIGSKQLEDMKYGIALGNEYGSHTENHQDLRKYSSTEALSYVTEVSDYVYDHIGYEMKTYRPPYGFRNYEMEEITDMRAILWNIDSKDWSNRDEEITYQNVMNGVRDGGIVLMHSLYPSSAAAVQRLVPDLLDKGYQLVTISELLEYKNIEEKIYPEH